METETELNLAQNAGENKKLSAVERVIIDLRNMLVERQLGVGDVLPSERELCTLFNASRTTVREAMRTLKTYGVVEVRPKAGARIIDNRMTTALDLFSFSTLDISRNTFSDVQGFRGLLEVNSVDQLFDKVTKDDILRLRSVNEELRYVESMTIASEIDFRFHTNLVQILGNSTILDVYKVLKPLIIRIMKNGKTIRGFQEVTYSQHSRIVDALEARDRVSYQFHTKIHLDFGYSFFNSSEEKEKGYPNNNNKKENGIWRKKPCEKQ